jgi:hypothetical protein
VLLHCTRSRNEQNGISAQLVMCMHESRTQQGSAVHEIGLYRSMIRWVQMFGNRFAEERLIDAGAGRR